MSCLVQFLYGWQTLISGGLAILAAGVGAYFLSRQITQSEKHERARLRARFASARAVLPLALDEVASYAKAQLNALAELHRACVSWAIGQPIPEFTRLKIPENVISLLREAVEALEANGKPIALELLSDIICEIQTLTARTEEIETQLEAAGPSGLALQLEEYIVQSARLYALALGLFPFARRATDEGPPAVTWNDANTCLRPFQFAIPGVARIMERKLSASLQTWVSKVPSVD